MINELIKEYRNLSIDIINELDKDGFSNLEKLLNKKGGIQEKIQNLNIEKNELRNVLEKLDILSLDKIIVDKINMKKIETKRKIQDIQRKKIANNSYVNAVNNVQFLNIKM